MVILSTIPKCKDIIGLNEIVIYGGTYHRDSSYKFGSTNNKGSNSLFCVRLEYNEIRRYIKNLLRGSNRGTLSLLFISETHL